MDRDQLDTSAPPGPEDESGGDDMPLSPEDLEAFGRALPFMFRQFPEMHGVRPNQLEHDDPVRGVLERFLRQQRREVEDAAKKPEGSQEK